MADREKILEGLEWVINDIEENGNISHAGQYLTEIKDALELLKRDEQTIESLERTIDKLTKEIEDFNCKDCNHYNYVRCRACPIDGAVTYIDEAPTVGEWISVEDRLPETSQEVLIFSRTEKSGTGYMNIVLYSAKFKAFNATDDCDEYKVKNVTHWMPLPKAPEG